MHSTLSAWRLLRRSLTQKFNGGTMQWKMSEFQKPHNVWKVWRTMKRDLISFSMVHIHVLSYNSFETSMLVLPFHQLVSSEKSSSIRSLLNHAQTGIHATSSPQITTKCYIITKSLIFVMTVGLVWPIHFEGIVRAAAFSSKNVP